MRRKSTGWSKSSKNCKHSSPPCGAGSINKIDYGNQERNGRFETSFYKRRNGRRTERNRQRDFRSNRTKRRGGRRDHPSQIKETNERAQDELVRNRLKSVLPAISLSYIAKTYFNKSRSWLNQRINGNTVNGMQAKFSQEELRTLDYALKDLSAKLAEIRVS